MLPNEHLNAFISATPDDSGQSDGLMTGDSVVDGIIASPVLKSLLAHWHSLRGELDMPTRDSFDPMAVPNLLPDILLVEVRTPGPRFFVRVHGTNLVEAMGRSMTGKYIDEVDFGDAKATTLRAFQYIYDHAAPTYRSVRYRLNEKEFRFDRLGVPIGQDNKVTHILIGAVRTPLA